MITRSWKGLVGKEVDTELEVWALEVCGQWRELADAGDASPTGAVDGGVATGAVEGPVAETSIRIMVKRIKVSPCLLRGGRASSGIRGIQWPDVGEDSADVWAEVDALGIGEDVDTGAHTLTAPRPGASCPLVPSAPHPPLRLLSNSPCGIRLPTIRTASAGSSASRLTPPWW